jgi:succinate dehydrogenase/fumarate reductase flavoprotein subunit
VWGFAFLLMAHLGLAQASPEPPRVLVIGGGLAGLSASIEALDRGPLPHERPVTCVMHTKGAEAYGGKPSPGARVTLIEKEKAVGGNSAKATSGINGAVTEAQRRKQIQDSVEAFR